MKNFEDFTKEERYIIAEYVYSYLSDILIKTDALKLIDVLVNHSLISKEEEALLRDFKDLGKGFTFIEDLVNILDTKTTPECGKKIMDEYYGKA